MRIVFSSMKFHLLRHMYEYVDRFGSVSFLYSSGCEYFIVGLKRAQQKLSMRKGSRMQ